MITNIQDQLTGKVTGIIHVGAHEGQEMDLYFSMGASKVIWYEPNPTVYSRLNSRIRGNQIAINKAVADFCGKTKFNVETINDGQSSSILQLKDHKKYYPSIDYSSQIEVDCITLDSQILIGYNALFIDVQGTELRVMKGAENLIKTSIEYIYTEVNTCELYEDCSQLPEVDNYLTSLGFVRTYISDTQFGCGDAFYKKLN